jgi:hypothetical protein
LYRSRRFEKHNRNSTSTTHLPSVTPDRECVTVA